MEGHVIRWFGIIPGGSHGPASRVPRNPIMRGRDWGWDAACSCGWETHTGGAIQARVREDVAAHLREVAT
jgi:hypothetical protein